MRCLSLSGPCIPFRVIKGWLFYVYAIIFCDQPLFTLYFSVWDILRGFYSPFYSLSLSIPFTSISLSLSLILSISLLSLPPSLYLPFYLSFSLSPSLSLLSIILFGVSNGCFRPCLFLKSRTYWHGIHIKKNLNFSSTCWCVIIFCRWYTSLT